MKPRASIFPDFQTERIRIVSIFHFDKFETSFVVFCVIFPFFNFNIFQWQSSVGEEKVEQTRYLNLKIFPSQILFRSSMHLFTQKNLSDVNTLLLRVALLKIHPGKIQRWRNIELRNINISFYVAAQHFPIRFALR